MRTFDLEELPPVAPNDSPMGIDFSGSSETAWPVSPTGGLTTPGEAIFTPDTPSVAAQVGPLAVTEQVTRPK